MKVLIIFSIFLSTNLWACPNGFSCKKIKFKLDLIGSIDSITNQRDEECEVRAECKMPESFAKVATLDDCQAEVSYKAKDGTTHKFISTSRQLNTFIANRFVYGATEAHPHSYKIRQQGEISDVYACFPNDSSEYGQIEIRNITKPKECYPEETGFTNDAIMKSSECRGIPLVSDYTDKDSTCAKEAQSARDQYNKIIREEFSQKINYVLDPANTSVSSDYEGDSSFLQGIINNIAINSGMVMAEFVLLSEIASKHKDLYAKAKQECSSN